MNYELSQHARDAVAKRKMITTWLEFSTDLRFQIGAKPRSTIADQVWNGWPGASPLPRFAADLPRALAFVKRFHYRLPCQFPRLVR